MGRNNILALLSGISKLDFYPLFLSLQLEYSYVNYMIIFFLLQVVDSQV